MRAKEILIWFTFIVTALWLQVFFVGVDFFIVGIILLLQAEKFKELCILLPIFILIQEGLGTFVFGSSLILYSLVIIFFYLGKWAFRVENFIFIFILSGVISLAHFYIFELMASLQEISIDRATLIDESTMQALLIPIFWIIIQLIQKVNKNYETSI